MRKNFNVIVRLSEMPVSGFPLGTDVTVYVKQPWHSASGLAYVGARIGADPKGHAVLCLDDKTQKVYAVDPASVDELAVDQLYMKISHQAERGTLVPVTTRAFPDGRHEVSFHYKSTEVFSGGSYHRDYPFDIFQSDQLDVSNGKTGETARYSENLGCYICPSADSALQLSHDGSFHMNNDAELGQAIFKSFADARGFCYDYNRWPHHARSAAVTWAEHYHYYKNLQNPEKRYIDCYIHTKCVTNSFREDPCGELVAAINERMSGFTDEQKATAPLVATELYKMGYGRLVNQMVGSGRDVFFDDNILTSGNGKLVGFHTIDAYNSQPMAYVITPEGKMNLRSMGDLDVGSIKEAVDYVSSRWDKYPTYRSVQMEDAVKAHSERVRTSSAKAYTPLQHSLLERFLEEFTPDHRQAVAGFIADATRSRLVGAGVRVPDRWYADARQELSNLANGMLTSQHSGIKM